jgi:hypothetical protein
MALPYPEGEVFFKRSVLKNNGHNLDPDNLTSFNSHALIEWCWNEQAIGSGFARNRICHVSGKYSSKEQYAHWNAMIVSFGTKEGFEKLVSAGSDGRHDSRHSGIKREVSTVLPSDTDEYEKRAKGGPLMTAITPVKLHPDQPYMYIDLNVPIRAVYFPLAQKPSTVFPDLCSYLMVDFRMRQSVFMYDRVDFEAREEVDADELQDESQDEYLKAIYQAQKQEREAQARELEEALKGCKDPKRKYEQKPEWYYDAHGLAVKVMEFDLYSGLGSLPDCEFTITITSLTTLSLLWPAPASENAADP